MLMSLLSVRLRSGFLVRAPLLSPEVTAGWPAPPASPGERFAPCDVTAITQASNTHPLQLACSTTLL